MLFQTRMTMCSHGSLGPGQKNNMINVVLVCFALTFLFLTLNLKMQNNRHKDKVITSLDSFYDVYFVKNLANIQNDAVYWVKCDLW